MSATRVQREILLVPLVCTDRVLRIRDDKFNACDRIIRSFKMIRSESGSSYDTHDFETDENQRIEPVQEGHDSEIDAI